MLNFVFYTLLAPVHSTDFGSTSRARCALEDEFNQAMHSLFTIMLLLITFTGLPGPRRSCILDVRLEPRHSTLSLQTHYTLDCVCLHTSIPLPLKAINFRSTRHDMRRTLPGTTICALRLNIGDPRSVHLYSDIFPALVGASIAERTIIL
jgi:hypothetical protein